MSKLKQKDLMAAVWYVLMNLRDDDNSFAKERRNVVTVEEAVNLLLRRLFVYLCRHYPVPEEIVRAIPYGYSVQSLETEIQKQLKTLRTTACRELSAAVERGDSLDILQLMRDAITTIDDLISMTGSFLIDIATEISRGESSKLQLEIRKDNGATIKYITLSSLSAWSTAMYGMSIEIDQRRTGMNKQELLSRDCGTGDVADTPRGTLKTEDFTPKQGLSRTKSENLFASLGFFVEAFADTAPKYRISNRPNVHTISEHVATLAVTANRGEPLSGQSKEAIKDRIEDSLKIKRSKLPAK
jgi:hypothetical protein